VTGVEQQLVSVDVSCRKSCHKGEPVAAVPAGLLWLCYSTHKEAEGRARGIFAAKYRCRNVLL
jgi:hypothetical protein